MARRISTTAVAAPSSDAAVSAVSFDDFVRAHEPKLRAALVARHGRDRGAEACAEALSWAWERWDKVSALEAPVPYLVKVGTSRTRMRVLFPKIERPVPSAEPSFEPGLGAALQRLSDRQRSCVVLIAGYGMSFAETAEVLAITKPTVQKHLERGLERLRGELGVDLSGLGDTGAGRDPSFGGQEGGSQG